jgi:hypothetical protein
MNQFYAAWGPPRRFMQLTGAERVTGHSWAAGGVLPPEDTWKWRQKSTVKSLLRHHGALHLGSFVPPPFW